jgi:hypothetical protein
MTMIVRRLGVAVVSGAILAASLIGCGSGSGSGGSGAGSGCTGAELDYVANAHGKATPDAARMALLRSRSLPVTGWQRHDTAKDQVVYQSGSSRITVFQVADASWLVDSYSFCG